MKSRTTRRRLSKVLIIVTLALNAPASWAQTSGQTSSQTLPPSGSTTTRSGTSPTQQPAPPGGREAGAAGAGQAATTTLQQSQLSSSQFLDPTGMSIERLVSTGFERRADLLAARQRLAIAEGRLIQSGLRPNPTLETEYGSARFLGGEAESQLDVGVSQIFETGGKRRKRVEVARAELEQSRAEVLALERRFAAEVRSSYARARRIARRAIYHKTAQGFDARANRLD